MTDDALTSARSLDSVSTNLLIVLSILAIAGLGAGVFGIVAAHSTHDRILIGAGIVVDVVAWMWSALFCVAGHAFADYIRARVDVDN